MPTFYFEFADSAIGTKKVKGKYGFRHVRDAETPSQEISLWHSYMAERIWCEDDKGKVTWMKNRYVDIAAEYPDLDEFFWIKLKCHPL